VNDRASYDEREQQQLHPTLALSIVSGPNRTRQGLEMDYLNVMAQGETALYLAFLD
jgi:hypothetical protein